MLFRSQEMEQQQEMELLQEMEQPQEMKQQQEMELLQEMQQRQETELLQEMQQLQEMELLQEKEEGKDRPHYLNGVVVVIGMERNNGEILLYYQIKSNIYIENLLSDGLTVPISKALIARWYTGCFINAEDHCFILKRRQCILPTETVKEEKLRAYPQPYQFKKRKTPLKTNGAGSLLGLTVLLDPMLHDQVNGITRTSKDF